MLMNGMTLRVKLQAMLVLDCHAGSALKGGTMKYLPIVIGIAACLAVGELSSLLQSDALQSWYPQLDKSVLTPPGMVFAVVWGLLYILMGVSIGLVWKRNAPDYKMVTGLFVGQLVLNFFWSVAFFFFHSPWAGMMVITGLLALLLYYAWRAYPHNKVSSYLFFFLYPMGSLRLVPEFSCRPA